MKVMLMVPYIFDNTKEEFTKNNTGLGIILRKIAESLGEKVDTVLLSRVITKGNKESNDKYRIVRHMWRDIFGCLSIKDMPSAINTFFSYNGSLKEKARQVYFELDKGFVRKQIIREKPDVVSIHGIGMITKSYIDVCEELHQKYTLTLHGLIGLDDSINAPRIDKQRERDVLIECNKKGIPVSVISSGIKKRIIENYLKCPGDNITVITNGTDIKDSQENDKYSVVHRQLQNCNIEVAEELFCQYIALYSKKLKSQDYMNLESVYELLVCCKIIEKKVVLCVGNITQNKNQIQLVDAIFEMSKNERPIVVLFGREADNGEVRKKIIEYDLQESVIMCGFCNDLIPFWKLADLNVFCSKNDGFGLAIIEGYVHGVPTVAFADLDAIEDVYADEAMLLCQKRSTQELKKTIEIALKKTWNKIQIKKLAERFSLYKMADDYIDYWKDYTGRDNEWNKK